MENKNIFAKIRDGEARADIVLKNEFVTGLGILTQVRHNILLLSQIGKSLLLMM